MASPGVLRARCDGQSPRFASVAVGVDQFTALVVKFWNCAFCPGFPFPSRAVGVGHCFAMTVNDVIAVRPPPIRAFVARCASGDFWSSLATGVGQQPEPFPLVRRANGCRAETTPLRIEPEAGKVGEDVRQTVPNKSGDVLQHDESRSHASNDPGDVWPEPAVIVNSTLLSCCRERLAWKTGSDEIHSSAPRCAIKGCEIVPDRRSIQRLVFHPCHESGRCVGVPLNVTYSAGVDSGVSEGKLKASVSRAEVEGM